MGTPEQEFRPPKTRIFRNAPNQPLPSFEGQKNCGFSRAWSIFLREDSVPVPSENKIWFIGCVGLVLLMLALLGRTYPGFEKPPTAAIRGTQSPWEPTRWSSNDFPKLDQPTVLNADEAMPLVSGDAIESPLQEPLVRPIDTYAPQTDCSAFQSDRERPRRPFMPLGFLRDDMPLIPPQMTIPRP